MMNSSPSPYPFGPATVADILLDGVNEHPERVALVDGDESWTWRELDDAVANLSLHIRERQALCWDVANSATAVIGALATFRAGGIWVGHSSHEDRERLEPLLGPIDVVSSIDAVCDGPSFPPVAIDPHGLAAVTFTSGTSGRPKAVAHSQHGLLCPALVSIDVEPPEANERIGTPLNLGILNMLVLGPLSSLVRGSTYVCMSNTHADGFATDVARHGVTRTFVVPTMLHDLVDAHDAIPTKLASLRRIIVGGSSATATLLSTFTESYGVRPTLSYGLSEAPTGVVRESLDDPIGSGRGYPLPHVSVDVIDKDDAGIGEIVLSPASEGPWANCWTGTLGYLGEPDRTEALFRGGRIHTGDLGRIDADGALSVTGRRSSLIIRGGKNVDPIEIETRLRNAPWISEALAVGVADERLGMRVGVLVVPLPTRPNLTAEPGGELARELTSLAGVPIDEVAIVDELPRNELGKPIRQVPPSTWRRDGTLDS